MKCSTCSAESVEKWSWNLSPKCVLKCRGLLDLIYFHIAFYIVNSYFSSSTFNIGLKAVLEDPASWFLGFFVVLGGFFYSGGGEGGGGSGGVWFWKAFIKTNYTNFNGKY